MPFFNGFPYSDYDQINLDWVIKTCKEAIDAALEAKTTANSANDTAGDAKDIAEQTRDYVDNYFNNLDVQNEINNKLEDMKTSGELSELINPYIDELLADVIASLPSQIASVTTSWLITNITQPTTPVVDKSLSVETAAADALPTGVFAKHGKKITPQVYRAWEYGGISTANGDDFVQPSILNKRFRSIGYITPSIASAIYTTDLLYSFSVYAYDAATGVYVGFYDPDTNTWQTSNLKTVQWIDLTRAPGWGSYWYRVVYRLVDGTECSVADAVKICGIQIPSTSMEYSLPVDGHTLDDFTSSISPALFPVDTTPVNRYTIVAGSISPFTGANTPSSNSYAVAYNARSYHILTARAPVMMTLDNPAYCWMIWTYNTTGESLSILGTHRITDGFIPADTPVYIPYYTGDLAIKIAFMRIDGAAMTTDLTDPTSDYSVLKASLSMYQAYNAYTATDNITSLQVLDNIPINFTDYHAQYDDLVTGGMLQRDIIGYADAAATEPIYMYSLLHDHPYLAADYNLVTSTTTYARKRICITSGMHGNERTTPQVIYSFIRRLCTDFKFSKLLDAYDWYIIPLCNPWGFSNTGFNADDSVNLGDVSTQFAYTLPNTATVHQGIRRLENGNDPNRNFDTSTDLNDVAIRAAIDTLTNNGTDPFYMFLDCHQASKEVGGDQLSGMTNPAPAITGFFSMAATASEADKTFIYSRFMAAGERFEQVIARTFKAAPVQSVYTWASPTSGVSMHTLRQWMGSRARYAAIFEGSQNCYYHTGNKNWSNPSANNIVNTLLQMVMLELFRLD